MESMLKLDSTMATELLLNNLRVSILEVSFIGRSVQKRLFLSLILSPKCSRLVSILYIGKADPSDLLPIMSTVDCTTVRNTVTNSDYMHIFNVPF